MFFAPRITDYLNFDQYIIAFRLRLYGCETRNDTQAAYTQEYVWVELWETNLTPVC